MANATDATGGEAADDERWNALFSSYSRCIYAETLERFSADLEAFYFHIASSEMFTGAVTSMDVDFPGRDRVLGPTGFPDLENFDPTPAPHCLGWALIGAAIEKSRSPLLPPDQQRFFAHHVATLAIDDVRDVNWKWPDERDEFCERHIDPVFDYVELAIPRPPGDLRSSWARAKRQIERAIRPGSWRFGRAVNRLVSQLRGDAELTSCLARLDAEATTRMNVVDRLFDPNSGMPIVRGEIDRIALGWGLLCRLHACHLEDEEYGALRAANAVEANRSPRSGPRLLYLTENFLLPVSEQVLKELTDEDSRREAQRAAERATTQSVPLIAGARPVTLHFSGLRARRMTNVSIAGHPIGFSNAEHTFLISLAVALKGAPEQDGQVSLDSLEGGAQYLQRVRQRIGQAVATLDPRSLIVRAGGLVRLNTDSNAVTFDERRLAQHEDPGTSMYFKAATRESAVGSLLNRT